MKAIDGMRLPYAIKNAISTSLRTCLPEVLRPDRKDDDIILLEERDFEPIAQPLDNYA